jgi:hypothetical protein
MNKYKKWEDMISNTTDKQNKKLFFKQTGNLTKEIMGQFGHIKSSEPTCSSVLHPDPSPHPKLFGKVGSGKTVQNQATTIKDIKICNIFV